MADNFIKKKALYLNLDDFHVIEAVLAESEHDTDPDTSLSDSEKLVLWKVRRIIQNIEGAVRYRESLRNQNNQRKESRNAIPKS